MTRLGFIAAMAVFVALSVGTADAQPVRSFVQGNGCTGYVGPGDLTTPGSQAGWWGLRGYSCLVAKTGNQPAIDLRRSSDNATCTAKIAINGSLDLTVGTPCSGQTVTAWAGADTLFVSKLYDQSNAGTRDGTCPPVGCFDMLQGDTAHQPTMTLSCIGGKPCLVFNGTTASAWLQTDTFTECWAVPYSISVVAIRTGLFTTFGGILASNNAFGQGFNFYHNNAANQVEADANTAGPAATAADSAWHSMQVAFSASQILVNVDGTDSTAVVTVPCGGGVPTQLGRTGNGAFYMTGDLTEAGIFSPENSSTHRAALCHNQFAYWGTSVSC